MEVIDRLACKTQQSNQQQQSANKPKHHPGQREGFVHVKVLAASPLSLTLLSPPSARGALIDAAMLERCASIPSKRSLLASCSDSIVLSRADSRPCSCRSVSWAWVSLSAARALTSFLSSCSTPCHCTPPASLPAASPFGTSKCSLWETGGDPLCQTRT